MLRVSATIVTELLGRHIEQGEALVEQATFIGEVGEHERWRAARHQWIELTVRTLGHIYNGSQEADSFSKVASAPPDGQPWQVECKRDAARVREAVDLMISFKDRLELEEELTAEGGPAQAPSAAAELEPQQTEKLEPQQTEGAEEVESGPSPAVGAELAPASSPGAALEQAPAAPPELAHETANGSPSSLSSRTVTELISNGSGRVFLLHGRNDRWKQAVANLLEQTGSHEVAVLNERPGDRMALGSSFERHSPGSRYAVILLTADDIAAPRLESEREPFYSPRAHQEVVFAMGILVAALTPRFLCVLYEDGVELPCDLDEVTYLRLDQAGGWQTKLLLALRGAGFDYDLNRLAAKIA